MTGSNQPAPGRSRTAITAVRVDELGLALLCGGYIAGFGYLSSIKLGLGAGPIRTHRSRRTRSSAAPRRCENGR
jgi:hypothetical protein